jgi:hypothetical protein
LTPLRDSATDASYVNVSQGREERDVDDTHATQLRKQVFKTKALQPNAESDARWQTTVSMTSRGTPGFHGP